jgi:alpha-methylacyl-CoA racemase
MCDVSTLRSVTGPLSGLRVMEFSAIGPVPFCGMLFSDMGADVLRLDRFKDAALGIGTDSRFDVFGRGKRSVAVDLKRREHVELALALAARADILIEGYRPGVMERLGLGPEVCLARSPRLVFGRMSGWGQHGPLAMEAGHDINYIALSGALHAMGRPQDPPPPPLAIVGDFAGGAMMLAFGLMCALLKARQSGDGQVVDAAIFDGVNLLMAPFHALLDAGRWDDRRGANVLDGGAPWYDSYETGDGKYIAVGAIEDKFYTELLRVLGLDPASLPERHDRSQWPVLRRAFSSAFKRRSRDEWCQLFQGTDACVAPALSLREVRHHPHAVARGSFVTANGFAQPAPSPRLSRTPGRIGAKAPQPGESGEAALLEWGLSRTDVAAFRDCGGVCT